MQGSTGNYLNAQVVYVENPDRGEGVNDLVYAEYAKTKAIEGVSSTKPSDWLAWERPPEGAGMPAYWTEEPVFTTATHITVTGPSRAERQYRGFLTEKGRWYAWGRDGKAETEWKQGAGAPLELAKPNEEETWELMVRE